MVLVLALLIVTTLAGFPLASRRVPALERHIIQLASYTLRKRAAITRSSITTVPQLS